MALVYTSGLPYNRGMRTRKTTGEKRRTLYIKNPAAHRLAEQLSKRMGVTLSDAVIAALGETLQKTNKPINRTNVDALVPGSALSRWSMTAPRKRFWGTTLSGFRADGY